MSQKLPDTLPPGSIRPPPSPAPPRRREAGAAPLWKCMCEGCGAPLQRTDLQCSYCLRATMAEAEYLDVTTISGPRRILTTNSTGCR